MKDKENIKIGLLAVIALTLIINTFMPSVDDDNSKEIKVISNNIQKPPPTSNLAANRPPSSSSAIIPNTPLSSTPPPAQQQSASERRAKTSIKFEKGNHDYGTIKQDSENKYVFKFTNTGDKPLIIENAKGSCGCTVPKYPREPIPPGKTGEIEVVYKPGKQKGSQTKTVTITANTEPINTRIIISAFVEEVVGTVE